MTGVQQWFGPHEAANFIGTNVRLIVSLGKAHRLKTRRTPEGHVQYEKSSLLRRRRIIQQQNAKFAEEREQRDRR